MKIAGGRITLTRVDDGTGYTLLLSNESYAFAAGVSAAVAGNTSTDVIAYKNTTQVAPKITKIGSTAVSGNATGVATGFAGLTADVSGNGTTSCKITFKATTALTTKNGSVEITVTVDGKSFTKDFSFSLALKGDPGKDGNKGDPTGIVESATEPTTKYTGMLWKHTGTVSGLIKNGIYRWDGTKWGLFLFRAENIEVDSLSAISANLGDVIAGSIDGAEIKGRSSIRLSDVMNTGDYVWTVITNSGIDLVRLNSNGTRTGGIHMTYDNIWVDNSGMSFVSMAEILSELNQNMTFKNYSEWGTLDPSGLNVNTRRFSNSNVLSIKELIFVLYLGGTSADANYEYICIHTPFGELLDGYYTAATSKGTLKIYYSKISRLIDIYSLPAILKQICYR